MKRFEITSLFNLEETIAQKLFKEKIFPWEVFDDLKNEILSIGKTLNDSNYKKIFDTNDYPIWIHKTVKTGNYVTIEGPTIICENTEIRHGAYIRGNVIIGKDNIIGNSSELKNSVLFNCVHVPHFNYVGDSILGYKVHIGAGVKLSNKKSTCTTVTVNYNNIKCDTKLKKLGAILGDFVEIGCNTVTNPGTVIGKNTIIYPCLNIRGYVNQNSILKKTNPLTIVVKRETNPMNKNLV